MRPATLPPNGYRFVDCREATHACLCPACANQPRRVVVPLPVGDGRESVLEACRSCHACRFLIAENPTTQPDPEES